MSARPKQLLVSIHDVGPRFEREVDALYDRLTDLIGWARLAMLVVPDHWGAAPIVPHGPFGKRLRAWSDLGVEIFLHGFTHRDEGGHVGPAAAFKARHLTAGEGEFLGLTRDEAARRMAAGRALIEDAIGREVAGFVAPAWLYGPGARLALQDQGFALAEDHLRVWRPADGAILARGPVITWASRSRARRASSIAFAAIARAALSRAAVVRLAVHPGDTRHPDLLKSIERTMAAFLATHRPASYAGLDWGLRSGGEPPGFRRDAETRG